MHAKHNALAKVNKVGSPADACGQAIICGLLVRRPVFRANGLRFESGWEPTTHGESCGSTTMSNDRFERTKTAGSRAPMVLNYSRCVVLGSGPA